MAPALTFLAGRRLEVTLELLCLKHATHVTGVGRGPASPALMHLCSPGSSESPLFLKRVRHNGPAATTSHG